MQQGDHSQSDMEGPLTPSTVATWRSSQSEDLFTLYARAQRFSQQSIDCERTPVEEHHPESGPTTREVSGQDHANNPGFSASQFASYERRLKDSMCHSETTLASATTPSRRSVTFDFASDLEKGVPAGQLVTKPLSPHFKSASSTTIDSTWTYDTVHVPAERQSKWLRDTRHTYLNVYRRLFSIVFIANMIGFIVFLANWSRHNSSLPKHASISARLPLSDIANAASANIMVAILIRQDYIVNFLFKSLWYLPHSWPLRIRRMAAKVYENGGVHSGAAVAGTIWFVLLTVCVTIDFAEQGWKRDGAWIAVLIMTYILVVLLIGIVFLAYPRFRFMSHNAFEYTHRFAGWSAVGIFWAETVLLGHQTASTTGQHLGRVLIKQPTFWFLLIISVHLVLPWLRLRKWTFTPERLSAHALRLRFDQDVPALSGLAIAEHPLGEWHPFATFPNWDSHVDASGHVDTGSSSPVTKNRAGGVGGSMIISDAGDWTKRTIQSPQKKYWVKGLPKTGVLSMAFLFSRVVVVTTGSGIGPCLSFLLEPSRRNTACRVIWSTPNPLRTYGPAILNAVRAVDRDARIIDTRASGRPDMVAITYGLFVEMDAEAVFVISNPKLTRKVVYAMETRGIPAFGPVWDS